MTSSRRHRLFLDSNIIVGGFSAHWGLDKAVLSLCAAKIYRLVLSEPVQVEVERNLSELAIRRPQSNLPDPIDDFRRFLELSSPEFVARPNLSMIDSNRHLIRHAADLPVLLCAIAAKPDWLLTNNTKHFTQTVARKTGLRIANPYGFFRSVSALFPQ